MDTKKNVTSNAKGQNPKRDFSTLRPAIQCNKCQSYRHANVISPSPVKVAKVREPLITNPELLPPSLLTPSPSRQHFPPLLPTPSPFIIAINKLSISEPESDSEKFIYQMEELENCL